MSNQSSVRKYPLLRFDSQVDWRHVNPELLQKLSILAAQTNKIIEVFSGYRSDAYSAKVGGFAGDPHTKGIAVDAKIDGKPIGSVISAKQFAAVGLITGNQPNFYNGKPDPAHVQLGGGEAGSSPAASSGVSSSGQGAGQDTVTQDTTQGAAQTPLAGTVTPPPDSLPPPEDSQPFQAAPGSGMGSSTRYVQDLWSRIQPTSPDTQALYDNAQILGG